MFHPGLLDFDQMYGQSDWPGELAKRNAWLLMGISFKLMLLPVLLYPNSTLADA